METKQHATEQLMHQWKKLKKFLKYLKRNENENMTYWKTKGHTAKSVLRGQFIEIQVYLKKQEKPQIM